MKLLDKFKIKENESENYLQVQEIKIPDLKQYLVNGYNEIRQVREELERTKEELEKEKLNKIKYEATLTTLDEFKNRDIENKQKIEKLSEKISKKDDEIYNLNSIINTYTIKERELTKKYEKQRKEIRDNLIKEFVKKIQNKKGNLSKSKIIDLLKEVK